tara:strand:+ start:19191 stop:25088 length:5898 start_codon:yes stop_codon:yes gene_type:complete
MANENRRTKIALFLVMLMVLTPLASGASITNFSSGTSEAEIVLNDAATYSDHVDGAVDLPLGDSITSASMAVSSTPAVHGAHTRIDIETMPRVWNPNFNGQTTSFSKAEDFQFEDGSTSTPVSLKAEGLLTDFESDPAGFMDDTTPPLQSGAPWSHGSLFGGAVLPTNCASGSDCWGTGLYDKDYTDDNNGAAFKEVLLSPTLDLSSGTAVKDPSVYFDSFHQLMTLSTSSSTNPTYRYADCAYIEIRTSPTPVFDPAATWEHIDIDIQNSSGLSFGSGYYQVGSSGSNNKIDGRCNGVNYNDYALGGTSISTFNPSGWASIKLDLSDYGGNYIELRFVLEYNNVLPSGGYNVYNVTSMPGWYIDNFRFGSTLPQSGWMGVRNILPNAQGGENHPNGYGILTIEAETTTTAVLSLDILDSLTGQVVNDDNGNAMSGLVGSIHELWDINSSTYPTVDFRFNFDSGPDQLSTPVLHGFSIGSRIGTGFNQTIISANPPENGIWASQGLGDLMMYNPVIPDHSYNPPMDRSHFSYPIASITPVIEDDCAESPEISVAMDGYGIQMQNNVKYTLGESADMPDSTFGFTAVLSYQNPCNVAGMWFDLEFAHHAEQIQIDVAGDGDMEYSFTEPAFDMFGRQTKFISSKDANDVHYGTDSRTLALSLSGTVDGGEFMLPVGATIQAAEVGFDNNQIISTTNMNEGFTWKLMSGLEEVNLGEIGNITRGAQEMYPEQMNLTSALNTLMQSTLTPTAHIDANGNGWKKFRFSIESLNATSGSTIDLVGLDVVYDVTHYLTTANEFAKELAQGVALSSSTVGYATVPIAVHATSGGGVSFSSLSVITSPGYTTTASLVGSPVGLYPNGEIYEIVTTHTVSSLTGSSFQEASLIFESTTGTIELAYSDLNGFTEVENSNNYISLQASSVTDITEGKEITWRFIVNNVWEDTEQVRIYAGQTASNGVNGLPDAIVLAPSGGNAVENDAGITLFSVLNEEGVVQNLDSGNSNRYVRMTGSVRLESLNVAPDPLSYFTVVEERSINSSGEQPVFEWTEIANQSGTIGGDFDWTMDLGPTTAGDHYYRFRLTGYEGGDTVCPTSEYRPDDACAIPFNLTVDQFAPELVSVKVLNGQVDPNYESNWRSLVDDTWVIPSNNQYVKVGVTDFQDLPATLNLYYWVEYQHDTNSDGVADQSEYAMVALTGDAAYPTANYTGNYNDLANAEKDPVGRVSMYLEGYDLAGNAIDGGSYGIFNDEVTYASMPSKSPEILKFSIENSAGRPLLNSNHPSYEGDWNQTMYAGNEYHLIVEAEDRNGWRDIDYIQVELTNDRDDLTLYYFPRNETAWTDSPHITIVPEGEDSDGPQLLRMDGDYLVNPFTDEFYLDLPIRINWGIVGLQSLASPVISIADLDGNDKRKIVGSTTEITQWYYSDGIRLDIRTDEANDLMITPYFSDISPPVTADVREGYVYPGNTIAFEGQYAYIDGILDSVYILPEMELTLEVTRLEAQPSTVGGVQYFAYGAGGADGTKQDGQPTYHTFKGGAFNINITAPTSTNEYTYQFKLVNLPEGALDTTEAACATSTSYGCGDFVIKVDANAPAVRSNTWTARDEAGTVLEDSVSTSNFRCVDVSLQIDEKEALFQGDISVAWKFYIDPTNDVTWPFYGQIHGIDPLTAPLSLTPVAGGYAASAECVDLWPSTEQELPTQEQINNIEVVFWIVGADSAGSAVLGGGPTGDGSIAPIYSGEARYNSLYNFIFEEASYSVKEIDLLPRSPEVGESMTLTIEVVNTGSKAGEATLRIQSVVDGGIPVTEKTVTTELIPIDGEVDVEVILESFVNPTTGMYYLVFDDVTGELLYNGSSTGDSFNVKIASDSDDSGTLMLIIVILIGLILVMGIVGLVVMRRGNNETDQYLYEDEEETKAYASLPGQYNEPAAAPPADVSPQMAEAMQKFPQWSQAEIQGYFDQGWDIASLQDWLDNQ